MGGDDRFLAARDAVRAGDRIRFERLTNELQGHDLLAYIEYWRVFLDLSTVDSSTVKAYLARYENSYLAEKLRSDWLKHLAKQQQWTEFDAEFPSMAQPDQELSCYALQSRRLRDDNSMLDAAMPLWMTLIEPPEACYSVLESLVLEKRVLVDGIWARIRRQFEANKLTAARYSMNYLPLSQIPDTKVIAAVVDRPLIWLSNLPANFSNSRMNRELATLAISRIARNDAQVAAEQMRRIENKLQVEEKGWAWSQIGWQAAQRHMSESLEWYRKAGEVPLSDEVAQWKARAALRAHDWGVVRSTIEKMPTALAEQVVWKYWLGRAYRVGGRLEEANALFSKIAGQANFYSNLADEELGKSISSPPKAAPPTREEIIHVASNRSLQRSLALYRLNMRKEGVSEWNWALRGMSDRELLAASGVAQRAGIFDRAIAAADRTQSEHDYSLRYLSPYSEQVRPAARKQSLDEAWVYGLMRQESRFVTQAKSSVGASGLMQLMPATARWVANKIGLKGFHQGQVNNTEINVLLGTTYMRLVMESLDNHPVLASAAYNAGPGRARKWRADIPLEGAIYAETIPFSETRDYVKKVMSNSIYYATLFDGKSHSIKHRLGVVSARTEAEAKPEELP